MRVLQLCLRSPYPPRDGGAIAMDRLARSLVNSNVKVDVLAFNTLKHNIDPASIPEEYRVVFNPQFVELDASLNIWDAIVNLINGKSYNVSRFDSPSMHQKLKSVLSASNYDCILIESLFMMPYVETIRLNSNAIIVYRAHNIENLIWKRLAKQTGFFLKKWYITMLADRLELYENEVLNKVDAIVPLTEQDESWFRNVGYKGPMKVVPIGVSVNDYSVLDMPLESKIAFHLGSMDWMPNVEGVEWLLDYVWPKVINQVPDAKLHLAGKGMPKSIFNRATENISVSGFVDDLLKYFNGKQLMLVPLFSGSGMRVKIIEGMAAGRTIISTSVGAEGIKYTDGKNILIGDDPDEFAAHIVHCFQDPLFANRIASAALDLAKSQYDSDSLGFELHDFIKRNLKFNL
ncbi:MAG: glycosyltransferase family 4 protein [Arcticibacter sp.]